VRRCAPRCWLRRSSRCLTGAEVFVKYENLQVTNSFKDRGAFVKLSALSEDERRRGVIAMSAGNHAQAVTYHARPLGIPATIVMPITTPFVMIDRGFWRPQGACPSVRIRRL
jgi:threonine dehydratase